MELPKIRILHLSDFHFGVQDPFLNHVKVLENLVSTVEQEVMASGPPDFCIVTGDITQSGGIKQFRKATKWFRKILKPEWKIKLFVVPGNHDVQRPASECELFNFIGIRRSSYDSRESFLKHREKIISDLHINFKNFYKWVLELEEDFDLISKWREGDITCVSTETIQDESLHLIGLNTSLLSCDNNDEGALVIDPSELNEGLKGVDYEKQLIIVAGHHPVGNQSNEKWLVGWNNKEIENILFPLNGPHIYLHGHIHKTEGISLNLTSGQNITILGAGACYTPEKQYPMSFAFYDIDVITQTVTPTTFKFNEKSYKINGCNRWKKVDSGVGESSIRTVMSKSKIEKIIKKLEIETLRYKSGWEQHDRSLYFISKNFHPDEIKHHFDSIEYECTVKGDGTCEIIEYYTFYAVEEISAWRTWIRADEDKSKEVDDLSNEIKFRIHRVGAQRKTVCYQTTREKFFKEYQIWFFPSIKKGEDCVLIKQYCWPKFIPHLFKDGNATFELDYRTKTPRKNSNVIIKINFPKKISERIKCTFTQKGKEGHVDAWISSNSNGQWRFETNDAQLSSEEGSYPFILDIKYVEYVCIDNNQEDAE